MRTRIRNGQKKLRESSSNAKQQSPSSDYMSVNMQKKVPYWKQRIEQEMKNMKEEESKQANAASSG